MAVVVKKEEKIKAVFSAMNNKDDMNEFNDKFKELFPNDWEKIIRTYRKEEANTPVGKTHPMPQPEKYLENMYKVWKSKV